jgi:hypothetical protein
MLIREMVEAKAASTSPCDSQTYNGLMIRFSATVGEEPEIEVALV